MQQQNQDQTGPTNQPGSKDMASWKPGSEADQAKNVAGGGDFGVPAGPGTRSTRQRDYVSENTKMSDPGNTQPFAWEHDGVRDHGAGARDAGTGSASGGDIDTDFIGVGTGGSGIAASTPRPGDAPAPGPADSDGTSNEMASPLPNVPSDRAVIEPAHGARGSNRIQGSLVQQPDLQTGPFGQGADAATNPAARGDDSFAAEVSSGEAQGQDNSMAPSQDTQGLSQEDNQMSGQKDFPDSDSD
jgi:hypothetical protein